MSQTDSDRSQSRRILSALADGDATDGEAARAFEAWRDDDDARSTWHAYQLIGDVLRSEDLATSPAADADFLAALRTRLAAEPVVLAPAEAPAAPMVEQPAVANARSGAGWRARWQGPLAMAAGFLAVIGSMQALRGPAQPGSAAVALVASPASGTVLATATPTARAPAKAEAEQIAPYIAAHRQSTMNAAFQMPGGDIRNASLVQSAP
jgi:sigma-E factor negative regulatory protein RseA